MGRLENKVVVITGASSGIGQASARRFIQEGAKLVMFDIKEPTDLLNEFKIPNGTCTYEPVDIADRSQIHVAIDKAVGMFGKIDGLANIAGINPTDLSLLEHTDEIWDLVFKVNTKAVFILTQEVARQMIKQGHGGKIVLTSSMTSFMGVKGTAAYSPSKAAVDGFVRVAACELAQYGINVNSVAPGPADTPMNTNFYTPELIQSFNRRIALSRIANPDDLAGAFLFFLSDDSSYVTGETLIVDGGHARIDYLDV